MLDLADLKSLTPPEQDLMLDVGQMTLDVIGIFEPTPVADLTNAVVSLFRTDWSGALMSAVGVVPYVGDLAKLGKFPKFLNTLDSAIVVARANEKFASMLRPILEKLLVAIDHIPIGKLSSDVRDAVDAIRRKIVDFLPGGGRVVSRLDQLTNDMLVRIFGSVQNVGVLPRQNVRTIVEFFDRYKVANQDPAQWAELCKGIDLHAVDPVSVAHFRPGDLVAQYVETSRAANRQVGQWMVKSQGAVSSANLGLSGGGRVHKVYRVKQPVEVLKSKAAGAADHWSSGPKPHTAVTLENGRRAMKPALQVAGGGDQYFLPQAWNFLEEVSKK